MTDLELLLKKLAFVETCVRELRTITRIEEVDRDIRERRFVERTLQIAVQAALDAASHIVSDGRLGEPRTNRELFEILARSAWITPGLSTVLSDMAGFRNVLVHGYVDVEIGVVKDVVENHLDDLLDFVEAVRRRATSE
jgi:uncharacterized protein YutE (UPF0331/DUF86 family)